MYRIGDDGRPQIGVGRRSRWSKDFPTRERVGVLVTLREAEPRKQIESQLDVSTRLAAISRLTSGAAHEIKNPLNSIALHLEVLRSKLNGIRRGGGGNRGDRAGDRPAWTASSSRFSISPGRSS